MNMDLITSATLGALGWLGILARNYYTQMANLRIEEAKQSQINEQRRIEKQEGYFERLFQLFTMMVGEEKDERLAFQNEMARVASDLANYNRAMSSDMRNLSLGISELAKKLEDAYATTIRQ